MIMKNWEKNATNENVFATPTHTSWRGGVMPQGTYILFCFVETLDFSPQTIYENLYVYEF